jgi:hypothetical protein
LLPEIDNPSSEETPPRHDDRESCSFPFHLSVIYCGFGIENVDGGADEALPQVESMDLALLGGDGTMGENVETMNSNARKLCTHRLPFCNKIVNSQFSSGLHPLGTRAIANFVIATDESGF